MSRRLEPRIAGLETEYAIRFTPEPGAGAVPNNAQIYAAIMRAVGRRTRMIGKHPVETVVGGMNDGRVFVENGGAFNYEALSLAPGGGLLEGATPECRGPAQLVLYQAAQDTLLAEALPAAEQILARGGFRGSIGLLKNCRDAFDHLYGAQENYQVEIASGPRLWLFRLILAALTPWMVGWVLLTWSVLVAALVVVVLVGAPLLLVVVFVLAMFGDLESRAPGLAAWLNAEDTPQPRHGSSRWYRALHMVDLSISELVILPVGLLADALLFVPLRRATLGFFVSRVIISGAGSVRPDGTYHLSEKALGIRRTVRRSAHPDARGMFEASDLLKGPGDLVRLDLRSFARVFRRRQRLQVGLSDSNLAQSAELLKVGTALIVLDLFDAGLLEDAPRPKDPVRALHVIASDPTLRATVPLADGSEITALELQRFYLDRAKAWFETAEVKDLETADVLRLWEQALDGLASDPGKLVGRLDWVTKRFLLERHEDSSARKKVDLRYHELVDGYFRRLEEAGAAPRLTAPEDVERAQREPPQDTPAFLRSRWIKKLEDETARVEVDWESIRIGGRFRGKVIRLADFRRD